MDFSLSNLYKQQFSCSIEKVFANNKSKVALVAEFVPDREEINEGKGNNKNIGKSTSFSMTTLAASVNVCDRRCDEPNEPCSVKRRLNEFMKSINPCMSDFAVLTG